MHDQIDQKRTKPLGLHWDAHSPRLIDGAWSSVASGEREDRQEDEDYEQDHGGEGADEGARDAFAEGVELLADGEPVGAHVALVRQVHDRRRRRRAGRQQGQHRLIVGRALVYYDFMSKFFLAVY